jgi:hypothetical protein
MKKKQYTIFFANLYEAWFERFPERAVLFGDPTNSPLSPEQEQQLGNAVKKRKEVSGRDGD